MRKFLNEPLWPVHFKEVKIGIRFGLTSVLVLARSFKPPSQRSQQRSFYRRNLRLISW